MPKDTLEEERYELKMAPNWSLDWKFVSLSLLRLEEAGREEEGVSAEVDDTVLKSSIEVIPSDVPRGLPEDSSQDEEVRFSEEAGEEDLVADDDFEEKDALLQ